MSSSYSLIDLLDEELARKLSSRFTEGTVERRIAEDVIRYLHSVDALTLEHDVMSNVPGKRLTKVAVFRLLVEENFIQRIGEGRRKAPFLYCLNLSTVLEKAKAASSLPELAPEKQIGARSKRTPSLDPDKATHKEEVPIPELKPTEEELGEYASFFQILHVELLKLRQSEAG